MSPSSTGLRRDILAEMMYNVKKDLALTGHGKMPLIRRYNFELFHAQTTLLPLSAEKRRKVTFDDVASC